MPRQDLDHRSAVGRLVQKDVCPASISRCITPQACASTRTEADRKRDLAAQRQRTAALLSSSLRMAVQKLHRTRYVIPSGEIPHR